MSKTVWVVGASSGIGAQVARAYARRGASLVLSARRVTQLNELAEALRSEGTDVKVAPLDVERRDELATRVDAVSASTGGVDVCVFCVGIGQRGRALETALHVDRRVMEINFFGPVAITKALLPGMRSRGRGQFVVVSSLLGKFGAPEHSAYAASKHALHGFFESLRAELHDSGISVSIAYPGYVATEITKSALIGDGSTWGKIDPELAAGMSASSCAAAIVRGAERQRAAFGVGRGNEMLSLTIKRLAPSLFSRLVRAPVAPATHPVQEGPLRAARTQLPLDGSLD